MNIRFIIFILLFFLINNSMEASFPLLEDFEKDNVLDGENSNSGVPYFILTVVLSLISVFMFILFIGSALTHNGKPFIYFILSILSVLATLASGLQSRRLGIGKFKSFLGISIVATSLLLIRFLIFG